jgi:hypothetical protein
MSDDVVFGVGFSVLGSHFPAENQTPNTAFQISLTPLTMEKNK